MGNLLVQADEVEWLEALGYGIDSHLKVVRSRPDFAIRRLENSLLNPALYWYLFSTGSFALYFGSRDLEKVAALGRCSLNTSDHISSLTVLFICF